MSALPRLGLFGALDLSAAVDMPGGVVAATRWYTHGGTFGVIESEALATLLTWAGTAGAQVEMVIDSAGARVPEGLAALGAFRRMYRAALDARAAGVLAHATIGAHCFGGASMLAMLAGARQFAPNAAMAMSGPAIIAAACGEPLAAIRQTAAAESRRALDLHVPPGSAAAHDLLGARLSSLPPVETPRGVAAVATLVNALARIGLKRVSIETAQGVTHGVARGVLKFPVARARSKSGSFHVLAMASGIACGARMAWQFADLLGRLPADGKPLIVLLDCPAHAATLSDEAVFLSAYLAHLAVRLHAAQRERPVQLVICGEASGGIYVALAAACGGVTAFSTSRLRILPREAVAALSGDATDDLQPPISDALAAGVIDRIISAPEEEFEP